MIKNIIRRPMSFYHTTPIDTILNIFSKNIDNLDIQIPTLTNISFHLVLQFIVAIIF